MPTAASIESIRGRLDARAAGAWAVEGAVLRLVAFAGAPDLSAEAAAGFPAATVAVPIGRDDLSIAAAAVGGRRVVWRAAEVPEDRGSGYWLRRFGADRSLAVPVRGPDGSVAGVVSVALGADSPADEVAEAVIVGESVGWFDPSRP